MTRFLKGIYYHWRMPKAPSGRISAFQLVTENLLKWSERSAQKVFCKLCDMDLSYTGNTANMITHLSYRHKDEYAAVKKQMAESAQTSKPLRFLASMEVACSSQSMSQPTILNSFEQAMPYPKVLRGGNH